ncbi:MAG: hypothetical protein KDI56_12210 [Xanthomonadales bacterium]|nr:hypothetical protein [Xanthomonadales bacterium]
MTGGRKLTGLILGYIALLVLAWMTPPMLDVLVDGLCYLATVFVLGNVGEHGAKAWRARKEVAK